MVGPGDRPVIYLHIGAMKTGTTFLQGLMVANKENLAQTGYLFPGRRWYEQDRAVRDVLGLARKDPPMLALCEGMWDKIATQMLTHPGHASILSMEFLSFANARQAARVVDTLRGADVHVILTVRDAVGALPAQWQTHCRNGGTVSWPDFARGARRGARLGRLARGQGAEVFNRAQGIPRMLAAWGRVVPADHLHVITVPTSRSDPMLLWERFASVVGVDPAVCSNPTQKSNPSLGQPSAELMRRINRELGKLPPSTYQPTLKAQLATNILTERSGAEASAAPDPKTQAFALGWNARVRRAIEGSGAHVVGELTDLPLQPDDPAPVAAALSGPSADDVLAAAATARDGLVQLIHRRTKRLRKRGVQLALPDLDQTVLPTSVDRWRHVADTTHNRADSTAEHAVTQAVHELTTLVRTAIDLQQLLVANSTDAP